MVNSKNGKKSNIKITFYAVTTIATTKGGRGPTQRWADTRRGRYYYWGLTRSALDSPVASQMLQSGGRGGQNPGADILQRAGGSTIPRYCLGRCCVTFHCQPCLPE